MNRRLLELALRKQSLQHQSGALRSHWASQVRGLQPIFDAAAGFDRATAWLRRYPHLAVAVGVALLVARPRAALRWLRRGFFAWQFWHRGADWLRMFSRRQPIGIGWLTRPGKRT